MYSTLEVIMDYRLTVDNRLNLNLYIFSLATNSVLF